MPISVLDLPSEVLFLILSYVHDIEVIISILSIPQLMTTLQKMIRICVTENAEISAFLQDNFVKHNLPIVNIQDIAPEYSINIIEYTYSNENPVSISEGFEFDTDKFFIQRHISNYIIDPISTSLVKYRARYQAIFTSRRLSSKVIPDSRSTLVFLSRSFIIDDCNIDHCFLNFPFLKELTIRGSRPVYSWHSKAMRPCPWNQGLSRKKAVVNREKLPPRLEKLEELTIISAEMTFVSALLMAGGVPCNIFSHVKSIDIGVDFSAKMQDTKQYDTDEMLAAMSKVLGSTLRSLRLSVACFDSESREQREVKIKLSGFDVLENLSIHATLDGKVEALRCPMLNKVEFPALSIFTTIDSDLSWADFKVFTYQPEPVLYFKYDKIR